MFAWHNNSRNVEITKAFMRGRPCHIVASSSRHCFHGYGMYWYPVHVQASLMTHLCSKLHKRQGEHAEDSLSNDSCCATRFFPVAGELAFISSPIFALKIIRLDFIRSTYDYCCSNVYLLTSLQLCLNNSGCTFSGKQNTNCRFQRCSCILNLHSNSDRGNLLIECI